MAGVAYERFARSELTPTERVELVLVDDLAAQLVSHLAATSKEIDAVHIHGAGSSRIQAIVSMLLTERLGFSEEVVLTPQEGFVTHARTDFFYRLEEGRGILAEVERGGTTANNHDLKDIWKAHISPDSQHLFLVVPNSNWKKGGLPREKPFKRVASRLGAFFGDARREIDIVSLHVFGYGRAE